jgi:hypothetical protein
MVGGLSSRGKTKGSSALFTSFEVERFASLRKPSSTLPQNNRARPRIVPSAPEREE